MDHWRHNTNPDYRFWSIILYGYSPSGWQQDNYDYQNVSLDWHVPGTPFTLAGGAGFTGLKWKVEMLTQII